ncbi:MAG: pentapeptide repeat-containing protein [Flavisolibacter sp.]
MSKDFSNTNLRKTSFRNEDLSHVSFSHSDLRGVDFSNADLSGANLTHVRTGITPVNTVLIFIVALLLSLLSGYVAMLGGRAIQVLLRSGNKNLIFCGWFGVVSIVLFIIYSYWKGVGNAIRKMIIPVSVIVMLLGIVSLIVGVGNGKGAIYIVLSFVLVVVMFIVGTIARVAAGAVSGIIFLVVAVAGSVFGRSVGGEIGTIVMAISCAVISKKALKNTEGFELLRNIASFITRRFGTSFRNSKLETADFSGSKITNADFSNADISRVNWGNSSRINSITSTNVFAKTSLS